ncbi:MAG UNVERIFIED_CONTAM: hypothetical protein LVR18_47435 [Planctomycetaceae bacterium]
MRCVSQRLRGFSVVQQCEGDPELTADRAQLGVLISHLLRNGCESLRGAGRSGVVRISGRQVAECIELRVEDNRTWSGVSGGFAARF